jgi:eukaryotic translation initiation factor 2C
MTWNYSSKLDCNLNCASNRIYLILAVPPAYYAHLAAFRARYYVEGDPYEGAESGLGSGGNGPGGSGGAKTRDKLLEIKPLPKVKENVKEVMFYC